MLKKMDMHTHSVYSDGKNTPEEMILSAIDKGFEAIGITDHAYAGEPISWWMSKNATENYIKEITALKEKYAGKIKVLLGTEFDAFSIGSKAPYDYVIGSVHFIDKGGKWWPVDSKKALVEQAISEAFGGDPYAYCEEYYRLVAQYADDPYVKIIGHFDVIEKFNEDGDLFDRKNERYRFAALDALRKVVAAGKTVEINTGGMLRVGRSVPYPEGSLLEEVARLGGKVCFSSDSHGIDAVGFNFDKVSALCEKYGL